MNSNGTFPRFLTVGFVGARRLEPVGEAFVRERIGEVLDRIEHRLVEGQSLVAISSLALGSDTVFAEVIAQRGILHRVFLPQTADAFFSVHDFGTEDAVSRSRSCLERGNVIEVRLASTSADRRTRFSECGYEITNESDVVIAVHPKDDGGRPGGTMESLKGAAAAGIGVWEILLAHAETVRELPARVRPKPSRPSAEDVVFSWRLARGGSDPLADILELKDRASAISHHRKLLYRFSSVLIIAAHAGATGVAAWILAGLPYDRSWLGVKVLLLGIGLALPILLHHWRPQRSWVYGRLTAELCRSVLAMRGLQGTLAYLRTLHLPEFNSLLRSLNVIHLKASKQTPLTASTVVDRYRRERIGAEHGSDGQIGYYLARLRRALMLRQCLEVAFYFFSPVALLCAAWDYRHGLPENPDSWVRFALLFVPVAFPMMAAAAIALISALDLDRSAERYRDMADMLVDRSRDLAAANGDQARTLMIHYTERALLHEVVEWYGKHSHLRGH